MELCSPMYVLGEPEHFERICGYDLGEEHSREPATTPLNQQPHPTETPTVPKSLAPATPTDHLSHPPNSAQQSCPSPCNPQYSVSAPLYQEPYPSDGSIGQFDPPTGSQALPTRQKQRTKGQHIPIENSDDRSNVDCEGYYKLYSPGSLERSIMASEFPPPRTTVRGEVCYHCNNMNSVECNPTVTQVYWVFTFHASLLKEDMCMIHCIDG